MFKSESFRLQDKFAHIVSNQVNKPESDYQVTITQPKSSNFIKRLIGAHNTQLIITGKSHKVLINYDKALKEVEKVLKEHMDDKWKQQESEVYIPALINKVIDIIAKNSGKKISSYQKDLIRENTLKKTNLTNQFKNAENLNAAAQTSIGQTTATYLVKNIPLDNFFKAEGISRELQSEITAAITNKIADSVYEIVTGQAVHHIRKIAQQEARRVLNPPKKVVIDMTHVLARSSIS